MSPDKNLALVIKYPEIFRDRRGNMQETAMCWGFDCGDGWYDILDRLCATLIELSKEAYPPHIPVASQVKEKYGGLRFYLVSGTRAQYDACATAELESEKTCEQCGEPGEIRGRGWFYAACDAHNREDDKSIDIEP